MEERFYSLIEMGFTALVVFGVGIWQLVSINRSIARDKAAKDAAPPASPEGAGHAVGEHGLHDG